MFDSITATASADTIFICPNTTADLNMSAIGGMGAPYTYRWEENGNVISNISQKLFNEVGKGRAYRIKARRYTFNKIQQKYNEIINYEIEEDRKHYDGNKMAIFNSAEFLEIAIYRSNLKTVGGASTLLGLSYRDSITVEFY